MLEPANVAAHLGGGDVRDRRDRAEILDPMVGGAELGRRADACSPIRRSGLPLKARSGTDRGRDRVSRRCRPCARIPQSDAGVCSRPQAQRRLWLVDRARLTDPELWTERYHRPTWLDYLRRRKRARRSRSANCAARRRASISAAEQPSGSGHAGAAVRLGALARGHARPRQRGRARGRDDALRCRASWRISPRRGEGKSTPSWMEAPPI